MLKAIGFVLVILPLLFLRMFVWAGSEESDESLMIFVGYTLAMLVTIVLTGVALILWKT